MTFRMHTRLLFACLLVACAVLGVAATGASAALVGSPQVVAGGLDTPWEVVAMPDGRTLVTERPGRVRVIEADGTLRGAPAYADATASKFLGMALHPNFACNRFVYLYVSYGTGANPSANRVVRLVHDGTDLTSPETIFNAGVRSDGNHDGGRIKFGPDGKLYVTTGDVHDPNTPQNLDSLNGKILRLEAPGGPGDGAPSPDNPFNTSGATGARPYIWSYGHRHPQGIDWDPQGRMWETEHGPSGESYAGGRGSRDEINRIDRGANYGWPLIMGNETSPGMRSPVVSSGDSTTWAPGGLAFGPDGRMYAPLLAGQRLLDFGVSGDTVTDTQALYAGTFGRLRAATASNGYLWLTTHNVDSNADEVMRVPFDRAGPALPSGNCTAPATPPLAPATGATPSPLQRLERLMLNWSRRTRAAGLRGLRRRGQLKLRVSGLPAGVVGLRLERGAAAAARPAPIAYGRRLTSPRRTTTLTLKLTRRGRLALGKRPKAMRLVLRATHRRTAGPRATASRKLLVRATP